MTEFSEKQEPSEQKNTYRYKFDEPLVRNVEIYSDLLGISESDFVLRAVDFEIRRRAVRANSDVIVGRRDVPLEVRSIYELFAEYGVEDDTDDADPEVSRLLPVYYDEEQMQTIMLGASYDNPNGEGHVSEEFSTWDQQRHRIHSFNKSAIDSYISRLEAESDGWQIAIDNNLGSDSQMALDRHGRELEQHE